MRGAFTVDSRAWQASFRRYCDVKHLAPGPALKKRAAKIAVKLFIGYLKASPTTAKIRADATSVRGGLRIRPAVFNKGGTAAQQRKREIGMRVAFRTWTASGWIEAARLAKLMLKRRRKWFPGGKPQAAARAKFRGAHPWVELANRQPAAEYLDRKGGGIIQTVLLRDANDMSDFIDRLEQHRRASGL